LPVVLAFLYALLRLLIDLLILRGRLLPIAISNSSSSARSCSSSDAQLHDLAGGWPIV